MVVILVYLNSGWFSNNLGLFLFSFVIKWCGGSASLYMTICLFSLVGLPEGLYLISSKSF